MDSGGSANKTFLFQQTKALLNEAKLMEFMEEKIASLREERHAAVELVPLKSLRPRERQRPQGRAFAREDGLADVNFHDAAPSRSSHF